MNKKKTLRLCSMVLAVMTVICLFTTTALAATVDLNSSSATITDWSVKNSTTYTTSNYYTTNSTYIKLKLKSDISTSMGIDLYKTTSSSSISYLSKTLPTSLPSSANYSFSGCSSSYTYYMKFYQSSGSTITVNGSISQ